MTAQRPVRSKGDGGHGVRRHRSRAADATSGLTRFNDAQLEELRDRRREHELEGAAAAQPAGARSPVALKPGPRVELLGGLVGLLDEQHDPRRASLLRPLGKRPDQVAARCPRPRACGSTHIEISCTSSGSMRTNPPTTPSQLAVLVGDEERLLVAVRCLGDPLAPRPVRLAHHVVVASREEVGVVAQHPQPRFAPAAPLVGPDGADRDRRRSLGSGSSLIPLRLTILRCAAARSLVERRGQRSCGEHSAVGPSQQPILKWQRGHWSVAWRHSIAVPQRQHGSACAAGERGRGSSRWRSSLMGSREPRDAPGRHPGTTCRSRRARRLDRRRRPDSNWCTRLCRPLPNHSATSPDRGILASPSRDDPRDCEP